MPARTEGGIADTLISMNLIRRACWTFVAGLAACGGGTSTAIDANPAIDSSPVAEFRAELIRDEPYVFEQHTFAGQLVRKETSMSRCSNRRLAPRTNARATQRPITKTTIASRMFNANDASLSDSSACNRSNQCSISASRNWFNAR